MLLCVGPVETNVACELGVRHGDMLMPNLYTHVRACGLLSRVPCGSHFLSGTLHGNVHIAHASKLTDDSDVVG